jgi:hypothetical protein
MPALLPNEPYGGFFSLFESLAFDALFAALYLKGFAGFFYSLGILSLAARDGLLCN